MRSFISMSGKFCATVPCASHKRSCPLPSGKAGKTEVDISGPLCQMFSRDGNLKRTKDPRYVTHEIYMRLRKARAEAVRIFENVSAYTDSILRSEFGETCEIRSARVDPRNFGYPIARPRFFAIIVDRERASWDSEKTLHQLLQLLMADPVMPVEETSPCMSASITPRHVPQSITMHLCMNPATCLPCMSARG